MAASQSRAVPSRLPVRMVRPSGLKAASVSQPSCVNGTPTGAPVAASKTRAVRSWPPMRNRVPSGLKAAQIRRSRCGIGSADGLARRDVQEPGLGFGVVRPGSSFLRG